MRIALLCCDLSLLTYGLSTPWPQHFVFVGAHVTSWPRSPLLGNDLLNKTTDHDQYG